MSTTDQTAELQPPPSRARLRAAARQASAQALDDEVSVNTFAYGTLKQWILTGRLRPGNKLIPQELADALSVSRTPIREALERLHQEGYAGHLPRRGYFVVEIAVADVRDLYQTREALELFALGLSLQKGVSRSEMQALRKLNASYAAMFGDERGLTHERLEMDKTFHLRLAAQAGNQYLVRSLDTIFEKLIFKRRVDGSGPLPSEAPYKDHESILDAFESLNVEQASVALTDHIRGGCDRLLRYLHLEGADRGLPLVPVRRAKGATRAG